MTVVIAFCLFAAIPVEDEIRHLEKVREEAVLHNDTKILADLYADGMTTIDRTGEMHVDHQQSSAALNSPSARVVTKWHSDDVVVRVFGDTAIVTERAEITDVLLGQPRDFTVRLTDVWVKQMGKWRIVTRQATPIARP